MRFPRSLSCLAACSTLALGGCHSAYIDATVRNATASPISLVEVDYPSASFGRDVLAPGAEYHYRFKVLGNGATKVLWTDTARQEHTVNGPALHEGDEGRLLMTISGGTALCQIALKPR